MNLDSKALKVHLNKRIQEVAEYLLPNGQLSEDQTQWTVGDRTGKPGQSLKLELAGDKGGLWYDFATKEGGDIFDLWQATKDVSFKKALEEANQFLEGRDSICANSQEKGNTKHMNKHNNKKKCRVPMKSEPTHTWYYRNSIGELIGKVVRWDAVDGSCKRVMPYFKPDGHGGFLTGIPAAFKDKRPLYGDRPGKNGGIVVTEGEKAVDAVGQMGIPACTSLGGCGAVDNADWSPLKGARQVLIWADNDKPGLKYAHKVANKIHGMEPEADIRILTWGDEKDDAVDFICSVMKADLFL